MCACDCHGLFTSLFFELAVLHEVRSGLPELCRHVLEGFHRRADLPKLDRAHMGARVIGSAELRLAQPRRGTRLTETLSQLAERGGFRGGATLASARGHGARRYACADRASTVNRQGVLEPNDGRV